MNGINIVFFSSKTCYKALIFYKWGLDIIFITFLRHKSEPK